MMLKFGLVVGLCIAAAGRGVASDFVIATFNDDPLLRFYIDLLKVDQPKPKRLTALKEVNISPWVSDYQIADLLGAFSKVTVVDFTIIQPADVSALHFQSDLIPNGGLNAPFRKIYWGPKDPGGRYEGIGLLFGILDGKLFEWRTSVRVFSVMDSQDQDPEFFRQLLPKPSIVLPDEAYSVD